MDDKTHADLVASIYAAPPRPVPPPARYEPPHPDVFVNEFGETSLIAATRNGLAFCVRRLLHRGANVSATTPRGWTALHWAAFHGDIETLHLLLSCPRTRVSDVCATDLQEAAAPIHFAARYASLFALELLARDSRVDLRQRTTSGLLPVDCAMLRGLAEDRDAAVALLISALKSIKS